MLLLKSYGHPCKFAENVLERQEILELFSVRPFKVTENNFRGNFKNPSNRQDFWGTASNLMELQDFLEQGSKIAQQPFLAFACFVFMSASRSYQIPVKVKFSRNWSLLKCFIFS